MKYVLGADFGTLSVRVLLVQASDGCEISSAVSAYPHGVMDKELPDGTPLPASFALQDPMDYLSCLRDATREVIEKAGVSKDDIVGFGLDCTADTCLPVDADGEPLSRNHDFSSCPHAWMKLWKHHGAEEEAELIKNAAMEQIPDWLKAYGDQVSAEWMLPKLLETCSKAPQIIEKADRFFQVGDWIVFRLTGSNARSASHAGFKNFYSEKGYPPESFLEGLHPLLKKFRHLVRGTLLIPGSCAGYLNTVGAALLGLAEGTPVAVSGTDALHPMPALGLMDSGDMLMSIGTSTCHTLVSQDYHPFTGICGVIKDGIVPGLYGYEAGQNSTGDLFDWMIRNCTPSKLENEARDRKISIHELLTERAGKLLPGQSGLLALDWWNGCRSPYMNMNLSGCMLGMTLATQPEDIYRALIEANAYGARTILENYRKNGIIVNRIFACGGITKKNHLLMQIYADVLGMEIHVADSVQTAALGSAIFASVAAGIYANVKDASQSMKCTTSTCWKPNPQSSRVYDRLYALYKSLSENLGNDPAGFMAQLKKVTTSY